MFLCVIGDKKPVEIRELRDPKSKVTQGQVEMWIDMMTREESLRNRPVLISVPQVKKFEIRIICWRSLDVPSDMSDMFAKFWMEGKYINMFYVYLTKFRWHIYIDTYMHTYIHEYAYIWYLCDVAFGLECEYCIFVSTGSDKRYETDTHWRCKSGQGSWNWRIKIPFELPIKAREMGRLRVQLWDRDIVKSNEIIGSGSYNLYDWLLMAYHRGKEVLPFKESKDAIKRDKLKRGIVTTSELEHTADEKSLGQNEADDNAHVSEDGSKQPLLSFEDGTSSGQRTKQTSLTQRKKGSATAVGDDKGDGQSQKKKGKGKADKESAAASEEEASNESDSLIRRVQEFLG